MPRPLVRTGGGFAALRYSLRKAREAGGLFKFYERLRSRNACKTCAVGMGGQRGGMVNEKGGFPEVCKKSIQAQAGDMQRPIPESFFEDHSVDGERIDLTIGRLVRQVVRNERRPPAKLGEERRRESGRSSRRRSSPPFERC